MAHSHWAGGPVCDLPTKKACEDRKSDWDAMQQVILAARIVDSGDAGRYRKGKSQFDQLVQWLAGDREDIMNDDGNPSMGPWPIRLRAARVRYLAGDVPGYNLYEPPTTGA